MMDLRLISANQNLGSLCREILASLGSYDWTLSVEEHWESSRDADLVVWDFVPGCRIPKQVFGFKDLFLVDPDDLAAFWTLVGEPHPNVLLKPVTRHVLAALLGIALSVHPQTLSGTGTRRAHRDDMLQCVIQANLRLQEYDHHRTNFLLRALHDFRAPLTALTGYCGLLLSEAFGTPSQGEEEVLRRMEQSARRLSRMADAMFDLGVKDHVKRRPNFQRADLTRHVEQALQEIKPIATGKRILINVELNSPEASFYFEPRQIEQLMVNLLDNACRFTPKGGSIVVRGYPFVQDVRNEKAMPPVFQVSPVETSHEPNCFRIDVRDSGPRIPDNNVSRVFEEHTSYAGKHDRSGGGLGLAVCRMIVGQHEGRIWAQNTQEGPMFSFTLPLRIMAFNEPDARVTKSTTEAAASI